MKNFVSVSTGAARYQDISLNPQKLAGMCAKLKCCLNYEVDTYIEAGRSMPSKEITLQTQDNDYYVFKTDILAGLVTYSTDKRIAANLETISAQRALEIIEMNKRGEKPLSLQDESSQTADNRPADLLTGDINRFDKNKKKKKKQKEKAQAQSQTDDKPKDKQPDNKLRQPKASRQQRRDNRGRADNPNAAAPKPQKQQPKTE